MQWSIRSSDEPKFHFAADAVFPAKILPAILDLRREVRALCKMIFPVSTAQLIPENALLASCGEVMPKGPAFLEVLPTDLCNHSCGWCFTNGSRASVAMRGHDLREQLQAFLGAGGKSILLSGGGEPLLFKPLSEPSSAFDGSTAIEWFSNQGAVAALITNGVYLDRFLAANRSCLHSLAFIRVSLDATSSSQYQELHAARTGDFERVTSGLKQAIRMRGESPTPAIGASFLVDGSRGLNNSLTEIVAIDRLAAEIGLDFVQLKHVHCNEHQQADTAMIQTASLLEALPRRRHEWWVHRYQSVPAGGECSVPMVAQVLKSSGARSPCCHLQHIDVARPDDGFGVPPFTVSGCRSNACRYLSMNDMLLDAGRGIDEHIGALRRLKSSLERHGFHPYRLYPSAPELVVAANL